ncbi:MAG: class I SAM-dependent methyltransferase [Spirochaetia bacterium]
MYDTMESLKTALSRIDAGNLLDVAVGRGAFLKMLLETARSYGTVTAVDIEQEILDDAAAELAGFPVTFRKADASALPFADSAFQTVTMANALHHVTPVPAVLSEIKRVKQPDGRFILQEMLSDGLDDSEMTHHLMHHLRIDIDIERGVPHRPVISGPEVSALLEEHGFTVLEESIHRDTASDPFSPEARKRVEETVASILASAEGSPRYEEYRLRAESLKERLKTAGVKRPRSILIIAR